jgi:mannose/fructose-specific phosphotransferase system component IIA
MQPSMRALLVTHGELGAELAATAEAVVGVRGLLAALSNDGHTATSLRDRIGHWLATRPGPALVFVDEASGSCGVAAAAAAAAHAEVTWVVGGVNIAMLVAYLSGCSHLPPDRLVDKVLDRGRSAVRLVRSEP